MKYLDLFELEGEFIGMFRDANERFLMIVLNVSTGKYVPPKVYQFSADRQEAAENNSAALALVLVAASVIRDFLVVEDREAQFLSRLGQRRTVHGNQSPSVVYLPRVRYFRPEHVQEYQRTMTADPHRAPHDVNAHFRRVSQASAGQLLLAMRYGFTVPKGYTFVRPHRRGEAVEDERVRLYRSRSASRIIFRAFDKAPSGSRPAWFDFERDVARVVAQMGLRVIHQAATMRGDGGVDIFAHDETRDRAWAIQCKCYAPTRKIGPGVIRELAGSLQRYPEGTQAMIVTTSSFTAGALEAAAALNVKTVDGSAFWLWAGSGSAGAMRPH